MKFPTKIDKMDAFFAQWRYDRTTPANNIVNIGQYGLTASISTVNEVAFNLRMRFTVGTVRHRPRKTLGHFMPGLPGQSVEYGIEQATHDAVIQRKRWRDEAEGKRVFDPTAIPNFAKFIDEYELERGRNNPLAAPKGKNKHKGLSDDWKESKRMLLKMYADILLVPVYQIDKKMLVACHMKYLDERQAEARKKLIAAGKNPDKAKRPFTTIRATLTTMKTMFDNYGVNMDYCKPGLMNGVHSGGAAEEQRTRMVLPREWQKICPAADALKDHRGLLPRFWLYTAARLSMPLTMRWQDLRERNCGTLDEPNMVTVWCVPAEHMKAKYMALFPIVGKAKELIEHCRALAGGNPDKTALVFPEKAITGWKSTPDRTKKKIFAASGTKAWTVHDLRRTMASALERVCSVDKAVIKKLLAHSDGDTTATKVYLVLDDELASVGALAKHMERMHVLFDDIEHGRVTRDVREFYRILDSSMNVDSYKSEFGVDAEEWKHIEVNPDHPTAKVQALRPAAHA